MVVCVFAFLPWLVLTASRPVAADHEFSRAQAALAERHPDKAVEHLRKALEADATFWEAHRSMGECLMLLGRPAEAAEHIAKWAELRPSDPKAQAMLAQARAAAAAAEKAVVEATPAPPRRAPAKAAERSLGDVARERGGPQRATQGTVYVLDGSSGASDAAAIPEDAPVGLLDSMRQRAEAVFRPRMEAVAPSVQVLREQLQRYEDACRGKHTTVVSSGPGGGLRYGSESAWTSGWETVTTTRNEETPECRALASDNSRLLDDVRGALAGSDAELSLPPSVYPGIREEVFARLAAELW